MSDPNIPELIISIYKGDLSTKKDGAVTQTRRNERTKVKKQIENKQLDWRYVEAMINFCDKYTEDELPDKNKINALEESVESKRVKIKTLYDKISDLSETIDTLETQATQVNEWNSIQLQRKFDEEKPALMKQVQQQHQESCDRQKILIKTLTDKLEKKHRLLEECKHRPSQEKYDELKKQLEKQKNVKPMSKKQKKLQKLKKQIAALTESTSSDSDSDSE